MKTVFKNRLYNFLHDKDRNILIFDWTEETNQMTDDDFMEALSNYAGFAYEFNGPGLLVNVSKFRHTMGSEVMEWRNTDCLPRYLKANSKKMAYLGPEEMVAQRPVGDLVIGNFTDRFFSEMEEAKAWLNS